MIYRLATAHVVNHDGNVLLSERPRIIVSLIPAKFTVHIVTENKAQNITASHTVVVTVRRLLKFHPKLI